VEENIFFVFKAHYATPGVVNFYSARANPATSQFSTTTPALWQARAVFFNLQKVFFCFQNALGKSLRCNYCLVTQAPFDPLRALRKLRTFLKRI
jgi:hypothetical protein